MSSDKVFYIIVGLVTFLIFGGIVFFASKPSSNTSLSENTSVTVQEVIGESPHVMGDLATAKVTIVEFSDFQCPACKSAWSGIVLRIKEDFGEDVAFVYRHFPLNSIHNYAFNAAKASEAAAMQGEFWAFHDELFRNQSTNEQPLTQEDFEIIAEGLGLNLSQFSADYESKDVEESVREDSNFALSQGLTGTPTFYVNGERFEGSNLYSYVQGLINSDESTETPAEQE